jgi:hypothetical protein
MIFDFDELYCERVESGPLSSQTTVRYPKISPSGRNDRKSISEPFGVYKELSMTICPKCGYSRQDSDNDFVSSAECPTCGIIYEKYADAQKQVENEQMVAESKDRPQPRIQETDSKTEKKSNFLSFTLPIVIISIVNYAIIKHVVKSETAANLNTNQIEVTKSEEPQARYLTSQEISPQNTKQEAQEDRPLIKLATNQISEAVINKVDVDLKQKLDNISSILKQPLDSSYVFRNDIYHSRWDSISKTRNYIAIRSMLYDYHMKHTYMKNNFYVCLDMAMDVWNILSTMGIRAKVMVGNAGKDISSDGTMKDYIGGMNHAWVMAEVMPSLWIPLETTGGYIVEPSMRNYHFYNKGTAFDSPRQCKDFNSNRTAMFETINEIPPMLDNFNRNYAGKPITAETTEYVGRMKQKLDEVEGLMQKVTASLQQSSRS